MWESEAKKLKENVRSTIFNNLGAVGMLYRLEMIDNLCRMGLSYHFEEEIKNFLGGIAISKSSLGPDQEDLHVVSLYFRLLRQYGYKISQDVFNCLKDDSRRFKSSLHEDIKRMLSLYEASNLAFEGEDILDEAKDFTTTN
ncbi:hypothetical protein IFM89_007144 [Coptis chinensis]|uniref:Terpene synthase N-terminal domain-containing protein n=1 Tax=Coptis chinensis TaxID=261450 RepID=A0A835HB63_9MAGN|nr:hypothetical protein IFM89_007144 [Coptis chinensis]